MSEPAPAYWESDPNDPADPVNQFLASKGLTRPPCRGGKCGPGNLCDNCAAVAGLLQAEYEALQKFAHVIRDLQGAAKVYANELRDILTPLILPIIERALHGGDGGLAR